MTATVIDLTAYRQAKMHRELHAWARRADFWHHQEFGGKGHYWAKRVEAAEAGRIDEGEDAPPDPEKLLRAMKNTVARHTAPHTVA